MKKLIPIILLAIVFVLAASALFACTPDMDEDTIIYDLTQEKISVSVSAESNKIKIDLSSAESDVGNAEVKVVYVKAYEYIEGENQFYGLSVDKISADDETIVIGNYKLGTAASLEIDRFNNEFDNLYCKYYVVYEGKILRGPVYATEIKALSNAEPRFDIKSKKGILGEKLEYYNDLNCSYVAVNLDINKYIYPNELFDENGEEIPLAHPADAIEFKSNGKMFYFRKETVEYYDGVVKGYYNAGAHITGILYANSHNVHEQSETFPAKLTYLPWATMAVDNNPAPGLVGLNTSNQYGFEYFIAMMEFMAERYSLSDLSNGYIANFVIGNEIDYARSYNRISEKHADLDVYMEEYSRLLRLSNLALKKYHKDISVTMPITQSWAQRGFSDLGDKVTSYAPKAMVEWLNTKTKSEGDYDWGLAPHCYTYGLALSEVFLNDTVNGKTPIGGVTGSGGGMTNDYETTAKLTFSNIELLDMYLQQDKMKFNGVARSVYLTEQGVSSFDDADKDKNIQAGCIAAIWYKLSQLDTVKAFCYYRLFDHENEQAGKTRFGLLDINREPKPSYKVYKYIDTQYSDTVAKEYLQYLRYADVNGKEQNYENGGVKSYMDLLDVFGTNWMTGEFDWSKAAPVTADTVEKWEDTVDLSGVVFNSANFLYDGTEKRIEALNIPSGIEVTYSESPTLTEVGTKTITAVFTKDGVEVGRRTAAISVGKMFTNKTVYNFREKIFVTVDIDISTLQPDAWIGLYRKGSNPGNTSGGEISYMYCYVNQYGDAFIRTYCLQDDAISNKLYSVCLTCGRYNTRSHDKCTKCGGEEFEEYLPSGQYVMYYFKDGGYDCIYSLEITVLPAIDQSETLDLSGVKFESAQIPYDGEQHALTVAGNLPGGVTVQYVNNVLTEMGSTNAVAVFLNSDGTEIERRYAVLTVVESNFKILSTNKNSYVEGEDVYVKAFAPANSAPSTWWVGLYLANDKDYQQVGSIYYYYVKDNLHVSGTAYDIRKQVANNNRQEYFNLPAGEYKLVLFNTSGYDVETEIYFGVSKLIVDESATLSVDSDRYNRNDPIMVTATQPTDTDVPYYVGLFNFANDVSFENALFFYKIIDDTHVSGESYDLLLQSAYTQNAVLHAGKYKVVLFAGYGFGVKTIVQHNIQIGTDEEQPKVGTIYTDKEVYTVGETIYVTAFAPEGETSWWVGLYPLSQDDVSAPPSIRWYSVSDSFHVSGGSYNIMVQLYTDKLYDVLPEGQYKVVLFNSGGYTIESQFEFSVVGAEE